MRQLILHIPHASNKIPDKNGFVISDELLSHEMNKLTDWYTDELFYSPDDIIIKADFNRIFCDPERFTDDSQEIMSKYGMGVLYTKTDTGLLMRDIDSNLKNQILKDYYFPHHDELNQAVKEQLDKFDHALIIDCHSFSDTPFLRDLNKRPNRPDINIGTDKFHTSDLIKDFSMAYFKSRGLSVGLDWPYSGTIVPLDYYQFRRDVNSIMIEVNRKLYLKPDSTEKNDNFEAVQKILNNYLSELKRLITHDQKK